MSHHSEIGPLDREGVTALYLSLSLFDVVVRATVVVAPVCQVSVGADVRVLVVVFVA